MATILLTGWREGLQKVALAKLQVEIMSIAFREAKEHVDQLLAGKAVSLEVADTAATDFFNRATDLGALCRFSVTEAATHLAHSRNAA
ncbi:MAG: hypothetical protein EOO37_03355 [Cytophagaceae bacterium]|nr:MAG: hypothetical protein EOO37_03355 [Cytophagaceae bacterium]